LHGRSGGTTPMFRTFSDGLGAKHPVVGAIEHNM
jgi:hypothetical protein